MDRLFGQGGLALCGGGGVWVEPRDVVDEDVTV